MSKYADMQMAHVRLSLSKAGMAILNAARNYSHCYEPILLAINFKKIKPMKRRIFKEFEVLDLIPYSIALLMIAGNIYFILLFGDAVKQIVGR